MEAIKDSKLDTCCVCTESMCLDLLPTSTAGLSFVLPDMLNLVPLYLCWLHLSISSEFMTFLILRTYRCLLFMYILISCEHLHGFVLVLIPIHSQHDLASDLA